MVIIAAYTASGSDIPDPNAAIIAARHNKAAIWTESAGADPIAVTCQAEEEALCWQRPNLQAGRSICKHVQPYVNEQTDAAVHPGCNLEVCSKPGADVTQEIAKEASRQPQTKLAFRDLSSEAERSIRPS